MSSAEAMTTTHEFSETAHSLENCRAQSPSFKFSPEKRSGPKSEAQKQFKWKNTVNGDLDLAQTFDQVLPEAVAAKSLSESNFNTRLDERAPASETKHLEDSVDIVSVLAASSNALAKIMDPSLKLNLKLRNSSMIQKFERVASGTFEKTKTFTNLESLKLYSQGYTDEKLQESLSAIAKSCKSPLNKSCNYAEISFPTAAIELSSPLSHLKEEIKNFFKPSEKLTLPRIRQFISAFGLCIPQKVLMGGKFFIVSEAQSGNQDKVIKTLRKTVFSKTSSDSQIGHYIKCIGGSKELQQNPSDWLKDLFIDPKSWKIISVESWRWSHEYLSLDLQIQFQRLLGISETNQTLFYESGDVYQGSLIKGRKSGQGKILFANRDSYDGSWLNDKKEGKGKLAQATGYIYEGEWKDNKRHGKGKITNPEGDMYTGDWVQGKIEGEGTYIWKNGDVYTGSWVNNKKEGKGKFTWKGGAFYEGHWISNKKHGKGTCSYSNGDVYNGDWQDDQRHGEGYMISSNGDTYQGSWSQDQKTGAGKLTQADGTIFEGTFLDGQLHGNGKCTYPNGDFYEGELVKGRKEGRGKYVYTDGRVYDGNWKNDVRALNFSKSSKKDCCTIF